ncbi:MAG: ribosomal protein S18-alanine N-acetyltransferase [Thermodesulfobacteriota bacterium]
MPVLACGAVQAAQHSDLDAIAALEASCGRDHWSPAQLAAEWEIPQSRFFVFRPGTGQPATGYIGLRLVVDEAEVLRLAVLPAHRGQGIGTRLVRHACAALEQEGAGRLFLEVRPSNTVARHLYAQAGFQPVGRRSHYYQQPDEPALILTRVRPSAGPLALQPS